MIVVVYKIPSPFPRDCTLQNVVSRARIRMSGDPDERYFVVFPWAEAQGKNPQKISFPTCQVSALQAILYLTGLAPG